MTFNLFLDIPVILNKEFAVYTPFVLGFEIIYNTKFLKEFYGIFPFLKNKAVIFKYEYGHLKAVAVYENQEINSINRYGFDKRFKNIEDLKVIPNETMEYVKMQINELNENAEVFKIWEEEKKDLSGFENKFLTLTKFRSIISQEILDIHCKTITTVQDRLPNAGIVQINSYHDEVLAEIKELDFKEIRYEQLSLF